jgi:hypothetical protein
VNSDIKLFLKAQLTDIAKNRSNCEFAEDWPGPQVIDILCKKAAGFFIYASTVIEFIGSQSYPPDERLALIISLPQDTPREGRAGIDLLYTQVLEQAFHEVDQDFYSHLKLVVGTVVLILYPLTINALSNLLMNCGTPSRIYNALRPLHSLLLLPDRMDCQVHIFHKSFPDFLTDPERCKDKQFFVDPSIYHREILLLCLNVMRGRLKKNICHLDNHAVLSEVEDLSTHQKGHIGDALKYACCFWTKHLLGTPSSGSHVEEVQQAIDKFFTTCLPYWIEVLALTKNLGFGVYAINDVEQWCTSVSGVQAVCQGLYLLSLSRLGFHASGQMIASASFWKILMPSTILLPTYTIVVFHYPLPHPGFTNTTMQCSHKRLRWLRDLKLDGEPVPAQLC